MTVSSGGGSANAIDLRSTTEIMKEIIGRGRRL
jgi:hypothetical protein